ncbi:MAG: protein kinase, partial [Archangium sp.]|nr:protein kinase [Archangium sp.]
MGSFKLARRLPSSSILTEPWLGTTVTGRPVVAHLCKEPWSRTNFVTRFAGFHRGWQGLRQVGVAPLLEVGQGPNGALWVVEEFIEGETLRTLMNAALAQKSPLTVPEALGIAQQVARGLVTLSKQLPPLHHGDVCGSTVIIGTDGDVRLGGIGLADSIDADGTLGPARAELFVIAPETLSGATTPQSDVFKLGLVLLELLTGRTVFAGTSHAEVKARAEKYPGLTPQHFPNFPPAVAALLAAALAKEPGARPGAVELESALGKALAATGTSDDPHTPGV